MKSAGKNATGSVGMVGRFEKVGKLEPFDGKITNWVGLWWHPEINGFTSEIIDLSDLRKFKGKVRLCMRKNKYFNGGENGRPNYNFCLRDANSDVFTTLKPMEDDFNNAYAYYKNKTWFTNDGDRLFTRDEVRRIIDGAYEDFRYGIEDPLDVLPEDFV